MSPIPTPKPSIKQTNKKRKPSSEPGPSKTPEKKKQKKSEDPIDPNELLQRLLQEKKNSLMTEVLDDPSPPNKKRKKKSVDSPSKKPKIEVLASSKQMLITSFPSFTTPNDDQDVKPRPTEVVPSVVEKSPKKKSAQVKICLKPKEKKSPKKSQTPTKKNSEVDSTEVESVQASTEIVDSSEPVSKVTKKSRKKPEGVAKKPRKGKDPDAQMQFHLKKILELAAKNKDYSLLENMLSSTNLGLKKET